MTRRATLGLALGTLLVVPVVVPTVAPAARAQTTVIDEGTFQISVRGSGIGTESFTIRRSGTGANATTVAQGRMILDTGEQTRTVLQFRGAPLTATAYQIEVTGTARQSITGRGAGSRFRATMVSQASERMREFLVDDGAIVIDDAAPHLLYFVAVRGDISRLPVILPRDSRQATARVQAQGTETIEVAGQTVTARLFSIRIDGLDNRSVWVDDSNRVLRVRVPEQALTAERTALP